jgi:cytochrome c-type biogenesis protein CcmH/NrfG
VKAEPSRIAAVRRALARSDLAAAEQLAASVVASFPEDAEGRFLLGMARADAGRVRAGIADIERAIGLDPRGSYRAQLARLQVLVRQDDAAAQTLAAAEAALPEDALGRDTMGCVYARLGEHAASVPHFREAVRLEPDNVSFRYNLAAALNLSTAPKRRPRRCSRAIPITRAAITCWRRCASRAPSAIMSSGWRRRWAGRARRMRGC